MGVNSNETVGRWPPRILNKTGLERLISKGGSLQLWRTPARRYTAPYELPNLPRRWLEMRKAHLDGYTAFEDGGVSVLPG